MRLNLNSWSSTSSIWPSRFGAHQQGEPGDVFECRASGPSVDDQRCDTAVLSMSSAESETLPDSSRSTSWTLAAGVRGRVGQMPCQDRLAAQQLDRRCQIVRQLGRVRRPSRSADDLVELLDERRSPTARLAARSFAVAASSRSQCSTAPSHPARRGSGRPSRTAPPGRRRSRAPCLLPDARTRRRGSAEARE